jgi:O-antigen/teichoic acid export membrane protein
VGVLVAVAALYEAALLLFSDPLARLIYAGRFVDAIGLIPVFGLTGVMVALNTGYSLVLRAAQRPRLHLVASAISGSVGLLTAILFTWIWGLAGAAASLLILYAVAAGTMYHCYRTALPDRHL